jgi:hypothetical protein
MCIGRVLRLNGSEQGMVAITDLPRRLALAVCEHGSGVRVSCSSTGSGFASTAISGWLTHWSFDFGGGVVPRRPRLVFPDTG